MLKIYSQSFHDDKFLVVVNSLELCTELEFPLHTAGILLHRAHISAAQGSHFRCTPDISPQGHACSRECIPLHRARILLHRARIALHRARINSAAQARIPLSTSHSAARGLHCLPISAAHGWHCFAQVSHFRCRGFAFALTRGACVRARAGTSARAHADADARARSHSAAQGSHFAAQGSHCTAQGSHFAAQGLHSAAKGSHSVAHVALCCTGMALPCTALALPP